jgi:peptidase S46-like protein
LQSSPFSVRRYSRWRMNACVPSIIRLASSGRFINRHAEIVGLNFDSNIQKLPNRYWYVDETEGGRAIRVHCAAIIEALKKLYGAGALVIGQPNSRWCVADPLPPSAALPLTRRGRINLSCCRRNLPLVRGRRERSERGGRSHTITYFRKSATFAMPALAQASSCSWLDPELPTPPITSLPTRIGTPPPSARMSATSRWAAYAPSLVRF